MGRHEYREEADTRTDHEAFKAMNAADRADWLAERLLDTLSGKSRFTDSFGETMGPMRVNHDNGRYEFSAHSLNYRLFKNGPYRDHSLLSRTLRRLADKGSDKLDGKLRKSFSKDQWSFETNERLDRLEAERKDREDAKAASEALLAELAPFFGLDASVGKDGSVTLSAEAFKALAEAALKS